MAHKTLIGGTAYEISGGKTLVGGTAFSIKNGKTLVGGTAYEVVFVKPMAIVTLTSDTFEIRDYCSTYITYTTPDGNSGSLNTMGEYELPIGTNIHCSISLGRGNGYRMNGQIYLNDETVVSVENDQDRSYTYTLATNITIDLYNGYYNGGSITITET